MEYVIPVSRLYRPIFAVFKPLNSFSTKRRRTRKKVSFTAPRGTPPLLLQISESPPTPNSNNLELVLDFEKVKRAASARFHRFLHSANDACFDLKTLVTIDNNSRLVFSCRRSTIYFFGSALVYGIAVTLALRVISQVAISFLNSKPNDVVVRRDRSLGGKEVVVARKRPTEIPPSDRSSDPELDFLLEPENFRLLKYPKLPRWWPAAVDSNPSASANKEEYQKEADMLVRYIVDYRSRGIDVKEEDIIELRRICRASGVRVSFEIPNTRDSFYRSAVEFVLDVCSDSVGYASVPNIEGESATAFVAGLAGNIGVDSARAGRMVSGAVAARTRASLLQAWAFEVQEKRVEAAIELSKICVILRAFPPDEFSVSGGAEFAASLVLMWWNLQAEMEMVARGLGKNLKVEQREVLLKKFCEICSEECHSCAADALGLVRR